MRKAKRIIGTAAALLLAASYILPAYAVAAKQTETDTTETIADMTMQNIVIRTVADLENLAKECRLDTWSVGKCVRLDADISVRGSDFQGIPIFSGCFDGQGHTISDIDFDSSDVNAGFFGFVTQTGEVKNLTLRGRFTPDGVVSALGGVTSVNRGTIKNCTVDAEIDNGTAHRDTAVAQYTGGITGINEETGSIIDCSIFGSVSGLKYTGGVAGQNFGSIVSCSNDADVNTDVKDKKLKLKEYLVKDINGVKKVISGKKVYASENTGGIAGTNDGYIVNCNNTGSIGTKDNGYNVGGITGRSNGYISGCRNMGNVRGNSNVGGIAGQMEPCVSVNYGEDILEKPKEDIDEVFGIVDKTIGDINTDVTGVSDEISNTIETLKDALLIAQDTEKKLAAYANEVVAAVNTVPDGINQLMDSVHTVTRGIQDISQDAEYMMDSIGYGVKGISKISQTAGDTIDEVVEKFNHTENTVSLKGTIIWDESVESHFIPNYVTICAIDEQGNITKGTPVAKNVANPYEWTYELKDLPEYGPDGVKKEYHVSEYIYDLLKCGSTSLGTQLFLPTYEGNTIINVPIRERVIDFSGSYNGKIIWDDDYNDEYSRPTKVQVFAKLVYEYEGKKHESVYRMIEENADIFADDYEVEWEWSMESVPIQLSIETSGGALLNLNMKAAFGQSQVNHYTTVVDDSDIDAYKIVDFTNKYYSPDSGRGVIRIITDGVSQATDDVEAVIGDFKSATAYMSTMMSELNRTMQDVNNIGMPRLSNIPPIPQGVSDGLVELTGKVSDLLDSFNKINRRLNYTQQSITDNARSLNSQFNTIADSVFEVAYSLDFSLDKLIVDASDALTDQEGVEVDSEFNQFGAVYKCGNTGDISGKSNVGGIAGTMSLSRMPVLHKTQKPEGSVSIPSIRYKATINGCVSAANVIGEEDNVGLICGYENLGSIKDCQADGNARSKAGQNVGGIAGYAHGLIADCVSRCYLEGNSFVGGIVGQGSESGALLSASEIKDCFAVTEIGKGSKYCGSIAGEYIGSFENNRFYSRTTSGVNSFNIEGEFAPVSETELKHIDELPEFIKADYPEDGLKKTEYPDVDGESVLKKVLIYTGAGFGAVLIAAAAWTIIVRIKRSNNKEETLEENEDEIDD